MKCLIIIFLIFTGSAGLMQQSTPIGQLNGTLSSATIQVKEDKSRIITVFQNIEKGIINGTVNEYEKELGSLVSITIGSGEHGYFSSNQAVSVLRGYFSERHPISFKFSKIQDTCLTPYATGRFVYLQKAIQKSAQIYVSLTVQDSVWVINQFNIY